MTSILYIYSEIKSPRLSYICDWIFVGNIGFEQVEIITDKDYFINLSNVVKFNYGTEPFGNLLFLEKGSDLLFEDAIHSAKPIVINQGIEAVLFPVSNQHSILDFDVLAASFWLLSRYEEYQDFHIDTHGRFSAKESLAFKYNFLEFPVINIWIEKLKVELSKSYPNLALSSCKEFNFYPTYDIDYAWKYRNKSVFRQLAAATLDLLKGNFKQLWNRAEVLLKIKSDPFDTFEYIDSLHEKYALNPPIFFWLLGDYGKYDKNISHRSSEMMSKIRTVSKKYSIGIHPSYASNTNENQLGIEIKRLNNITGIDIKKSRQHFLVLTFPKTYKSLLENQISEDYSMGYADEIGFRASTSCSFTWYNLSENQKTDLRVYPFVLMDVTLKNYMKLSVEESKMEIQKMIDITKTYGGDFYSIWHNNSLCEEDDWKGWREVYEYLLSVAEKEQ
jgi:hypothetical protein